MSCSEIEGWTWSLLRSVTCFARRPPVCLDETVVAMSGGGGSAIRMPGQVDECEVVAGASQALVADGHGDLEIPLYVCWIVVRRRSSNPLLRNTRLNTSTCRRKHSSTMKKLVLQHLSHQAQPGFIDHRIPSMCLPGPNPSPWLGAPSPTALPALLREDALPEVVMEHTGYQQSPAKSSQSFCTNIPCSCRKANQIKSCTVNATIYTSQ